LQTHKQVLKVLYTDGRCIAWILRISVSACVGSRIELREHVGDFIGAARVRRHAAAAAVFYSKTGIECDLHFNSVNF
jgi:hypothetical protein